MKLAKSRYQGSSDRLMVGLFGDIHAGNRFFSEKALDEGLYFVKQHRSIMRIALVGDLAECATKTSIGRGIYDESFTPNEQRKFLYSKFEPYKDLIDGAVTGNHEERIAEHNSIDLIEVLCDQWGGVPYMGYRGFLVFSWNQVAYTMDLWHGATGGSTDGGALNALYKMASFSQSDIYVMGHTHKKFDKHKPIWKPDTRNGKAILTKALFINSGTCLDNGGYGEKKGFAPLETGIPFLELGGLKGNKYTKCMWIGG